MAPCSGASAVWTKEPRRHRPLRKCRRGHIQWVCFCGAAGAWSSTSEPPQSKSDNANSSASGPSFDVAHHAVWGFVLFYRTSFSSLADFFSGRGLSHAFQTSTATGMLERTRPPSLSDALSFWKADHGSANLLGSFTDSPLSSRVRGRGNVLSTASTHSACENTEEASQC